MPTFLNLDDDDGSSGPAYEEIVHLLEDVEPSDDLQELRERLALIDEAPRILGDARRGTQAAAASAREDREASTIFEANLRRDWADPRTPNPSPDVMADAQSRLERDRARAAAADAKDAAALARVAAARVVRRNVFSEMKRRLTANPGDAIGALQFVVDEEASADAGLLAHIALKPQGKVKRALGMVGLGEPAKRQFADTGSAVHDCRIEINRLRSERESIKAEHAPVAELREKAMLKARTLGRTSQIRVVVDREGSVSLAFPQRPIGLTAPSGTKLGTTDAEGLICALLPDLVEAAIDRSLSEQFNANAGMTSAEKKKRLREIDEQILAVERLEARAEWQRARETGEPIAFRADLSPRAVLGLA